MSKDPIWDARRRVDGMRSQVERIVAQDSEQDVLALGMISVNEVINYAREVLPQPDPVLERMFAMITPEHLEADGHMRAQEVLLILQAVHDAIAAQLPPIPSTSRRWGRA